MKKKYVFSFESTANEFAADLKKDSKVKNVAVTSVDKQFEVSFETSNKFESKAGCGMDHEDKAGDYKKKDEANYVSKEEMYNEIHGLSNFIMEEFHYEMKWAYARIRELEEAMYRHERGHLPAINDAGKMQQALNSLGLGESYDIVKPTIRVQASRHGNEITIE